MAKSCKIPSTFFLRKNCLQTILGIYYGVANLEHLVCVYNLFDNLNCFCSVLLFAHCIFYFLFVVLEDFFFSELR